MRYRRVEDILDRGLLDEFARNPFSVRLRYEGRLTKLSWDEAVEYVRAGRTLAERVGGGDPRKQLIERFAFIYLVYNCRSLGEESVRIAPKEVA